MIKYSSAMTLSLFALACSSDPGAPSDGTAGTDAGLGTSGTGVVALGGSGSSGGASSGSLGGTNGLGGMTLVFGGSASSSAGAGNASGEVAPETVEALRKSSCAGWSAEPEALPAVLELVIDVSLSMNESSRTTKGRSKWAITREALGKAIDTMPASTAVGMLYYPNQRTTGSNSPRDVSACVKVDAMLGVALLAGSDSPQRAAIRRSLEQTNPNGSTPTHDAYRHALLSGLDSSRLAGNRFMLLITDGAPTLAQQCVGVGTPQHPSPTQPILDEVKAARARGIRTFVIGSPGTEVSVNGGDARPWMSEAARLGGTAKSDCSDSGPNFCHVDLTQAEDFGAALGSALGDVAGQVVSCSYALPLPPANQELDLAKINVIFTPADGQPELVGRATAADCKEGYRIADDGEVVLCSDTCAAAQADPRASLEVLFGCAAAPVPVR